MTTTTPPDVTLEQVAENTAIKLRKAKNGFFPFREVILTALRQVAIRHERLGMERAAGICKSNQEIWERNSKVMSKEQQLKQFEWIMAAYDCEQAIRSAANGIEGGTK